MLLILTETTKDIFEKWSAIMSKFTFVMLKLTFDPFAETSVKILPDVSIDAP